MLQCSTLCSEMESALRMLWDCCKGQEGSHLHWTQHPHFKPVLSPHLRRTLGWLERTWPQLAPALCTTQEHPKPTCVTNKSICGESRRLGVWICTSTSLPGQGPACVALRSQGCAPSRPQGVCQAAVNKPLCLEPHSGAGSAPTLPHQHFWEVHAEQRWSRTCCSRGIVTQCKNYQKPGAERCHSDAKNVFVNPKENGEGSNESTSASPQPAQKEDRLLITCWMKQMKEAKLGKDNSFLDGLQKHCHLRDRG